MTHESDEMFCLPLQRGPSEAWHLHRWVRRPGFARARQPPDSTSSLSLSPITHAPRPFVPQPHNTPRTCMRPAQAPPRATSHSGCRRALAHSSELRFRTCGPPTGKTRKEPSCSAASAVPYGRAHRDDMIKLTSAAILTHAEVNTYHLLTYYYLLTYARRGATEVLQRCYRGLAVCGLGGRARAYSAASP